MEDENVIYTIEGYNDIVNPILDNIGEQEVITTQLAEAQSFVTAILAENVALKGANEELVINNEKLKEANMALYLKISKQNEPEPNDEEESDESKLTFEALFNEKGELI